MQDTGGVPIRIEPGKAVAQPESNVRLLARLTFFDGWPSVEVESWEALREVLDRYNKRVSEEKALGGEDAPAA
jgi:hypothetical protein